MDFISRFKKALEHPGTKPGQRQRNHPKKLLLSVRENLSYNLKTLLWKFRLIQSEPLLSTTVSD